MYFQSQNCKKMAINRHSKIVDCNVISNCRISDLCIEIFFSVAVLCVEDHLMIAEEDIMYSFSAWKVKERLLYVHVHTWFIFCYSVACISA